MLANATVSTNFPGWSLLYLSPWPYHLFQGLPRDTQARFQTKIYIHSPQPMALSQISAMDMHAASRGLHLHKLDKHFQQATVLRKLLS